jgi:hypothetical protein
MKVVVTGDRHWIHFETVFNVISDLPHNVTIIHGDCSGADRLAEKVAEMLGFQVKRFPADWKKHGLAAGPIRNREMLQENPDLVLAFHDDLNKSKGTKDCVEAALTRDIPVELWKSDGTHTNLGVG